MDRNMLDTLFVPSLSYYIHGMDSSKYYTTLSQIGATMGYDEDGHAILTSWTFAGASEPSIQQLLDEEAINVNAYWRVINDVPQAMSTIPLLTVTEAAMLATIGGLPDGGFVRIGTSLAVWLDGGWKFVSLTIPT